MLVPAIAKKTELEEQFARRLYDEDMFLYNGYPHCNTIPDMTPAENHYNWAIVDNDRVIGFFTYYVDAFSGNVCRFGLYSFDRGNPLIGIDVYKKIRELIRNYHRIEWRMISGNQVQKHYDSLCRRFGGNKVVLHQVCKDGKGEYHDEYIYEIISKGR